VIACAKSRVLPPAEIQFDYGDHAGKVSALEPLVGEAGWLSLVLLSVEALGQAEDHLLFAAHTDSGQALDEDMACRLLTLPGRVETEKPVPQGIASLLEEGTRRQQKRIQRDISERNTRFFEAETEKLDGWADDLKLGLERELREIDRQIKEARRAATLALTLEEKLNGQKQIKTLEALRNQKRRSLFDAQDQVDKQREELIAQVEGTLNQTSDLQPLFTIRWKLT
jgi:hypothetical protein